MKEFYWRGLDIAGKTQTGKILAVSPESVKEKLLKKEIALLSVREKKSWRSIGTTSNLKKQNLLTFFSQLATLTHHGVPLASALTTISSTVQLPQLHSLVSSLQASLNKGQSLAFSLEEQKVLASPYIRLIEVGEKTGKLSQSLYSIASNLEQQITLENNIKTAARMPLFTLAFALVIVTLIFIVVIPQFATLFASLNKPLPALTEHVLSLSSLFSSLKGLLGILGIGSLGLLLYKKCAHSETFLLIKEGIINRLPVIGSIIQSKRGILILDLTSNLLQAGISLREALSLVHQEMSQKHLHHSLSLVERDITHGKQLHETFQKHLPFLFDAEVQAIINVGEQTGKLGSMMHKSSQLLQKKLQLKLSLITTFIQPLLLIITGIIIVLLMVAIYLPIFYMADIT